MLPTIQSFYHDVVHLQVFSSKHLFAPVDAKVPPSPMADVRAPKSDNEIRRKPVGQVPTDTQFDSSVIWTIYSWVASISSVFCFHYYNIDILFVNS
ncbi:hypothetical protein HanPSC8_Chr17g0775351 [Helianthus annuus]|nr:hypothetical protein HanPSC8_Chr17g0775351 [Helianthus annuus]